MLADIDVRERVVECFERHAELTAAGEGGTLSRH